jgi:hypothetical protein
MKSFVRGNNTKYKTSCRKSKWEVSFAQLRKRFVVVVVDGGGGGDCAGAAAADDVSPHSIV